MIVLAIFTAFYYRQPVTSASGSPLACKTIISNGSPDKSIDIVFFYDNVDESEAQQYIDYLLSVSPFSENKEKFNFYSVNMPPTCDIQNGILVCYSKEVIKASALCPNDYVFVLSKQSAGIRSSAYTNLISVNIADKKSVVIHEFGHIFANLADEYVPSTIPRGSKNCASSCDKFTSEVDGCYEGCSENGEYRSVNAGIMRTLSTINFGKFDNAILNADLEKYG